MKNVFYFLMILLFSCKSTLVYEDLKGEYIREGKDYTYKLKIMGDSTFSLVTQSIHARSGCEGKFRYLSNDTLLLKCNEEPLSAQLARGYMADREKKVIILNKNKLKLGQVVMKRSN